MKFAFTKAGRRKNLLAEPFPEAWLDIVRKNVFLYRLLSETEQAKLARCPAHLHRREILGRLPGPGNHG